MSKTENIIANFFKKALLLASELVNKEELTEKEKGLLDALEEMDDSGVFAELTKSAVEEAQAKTIYLLVGPSGSGKTTLSQYLKEWGISELISTTTREPRKGEVEGINYYYVTPEQFADISMIESVEYAGNKYGTSVSEIERVFSQHDKCFAVVEREGVRAYRNLYGDIIKVIYIHAPFSILIERMKARNDPPKVISQRVKHALGTNEQDSINIADYCIINLDLDEAKRQLRCIVGV